MTARAASIWHLPVSCMLQLQHDIGSHRWNAGLQDLLSSNNVGTFKYRFSRLRSEEKFYVLELLAELRGSEWTLAEASTALYYSFSQEQVRAAALPGLKLTVDHVPQARQEAAANASIRRKRRGVCCTIYRTLHEAEVAIMCSYNLGRVSLVGCFSLLLTHYASYCTCMSSQDMADMLL